MFISLSLVLPLPLNNFHSAWFKCRIIRGFQRGVLLFGNQWEDSTGHRSKRSALINLIWILFGLLWPAEWCPGQISHKVLVRTIIWHIEKDRHFFFPLEYIETNELCPIKSTKQVTVTYFKNLTRASHPMCLQTRHEPRKSNHLDLCSQCWQTDGQTDSGQQVIA